MASGNDGPAKTFLMFSLFGIAAIISSITMGKLYPEHSYNDSEEKFATETPKKRLIQRHPGFFFVIFLLFGTIFILLLVLSWLSSMRFVFVVTGILPIR